MANWQYDLIKRQSIIIKGKIKIQIKDLLKIGKL
jgi:hypothetical protein